MTTFTAMFDAKWKTVCCDHCGAEFAYRVHGPRGSLEDSAGAVHCPCCGYFQASMLRAVRREAFGFFAVLAGLATLVAVVAGLLSGGEVSAAVPFACAAAALFLVGRVKMARFDPNAEASSRAGIRQHSCVILREEYELVRSIARRRAEPLMPLTWGARVFAH